MGRQGTLVKRITDILLSFFILMITSPILIISALAIKLESKGPVFFVQERTGIGGNNFRLFKFRGMIDNATRYGPELTQINDPRVTKVGKFLRRTSIDEIPNFINVIMGEMSIIGPRPEIPSITANYNPEQKKVFKFKPGITGYSQVNGRQMLTPDQRVKMELDYYETETFYSDIIIFLRTLHVVATNQGNT